MDFNKLAKEVHQNAIDKGFYEASQDETEKLMLVVSEFAECLEAHRSGKFADLAAFDNRLKELYTSHNQNAGDFKEYTEKTFPQVFKRYIKDTVEDELADVVIRLLDYAGWKKYELDIYNGIDNILSNRSLVKLMYHVISSITLIRYELPTAGVSDCIELIFAYCNANNINIQRHIELKMQYNAGRERLHGKKY